MGVKGFNKGMNKKYPDLYRLTPLINFAGHRVAIDISIYFYVAKANCIKRALNYIDLKVQDIDNGIVTSFWLQYICEEMMLYIESDIMPIPVFDGPHHRLKIDTQKDRKNAVDKRKSTIKELQKQLAQDDPNPRLISDLEKNLRNTIEIHNHEVVALKKMFDEMGIKYIQADTEAECLCAYLCRQKYVSAVVTKDSDIFVYRCPIVITQVEKKYQLGRPKHKCTYVIYEDMLDIMNMKEDEFIDFCILSGTDYNDNLAIIQEKKAKPFSLGFNRAMALVDKHGKIEQVLENVQDKGFVSTYDICNMLLEKYGPMTRDFFEDLINRKTIEISNNTIINIDVRNEIRNYFLSDPKFDINEHQFIMFINSDLSTCFEEIFIGPNKENMLLRANEICQKIISFEHRFAMQQEFNLVII